MNCLTVCVWVCVKTNNAKLHLKEASCSVLLGVTATLFLFHHFPYNLFFRLHPCISALLPPPSLSPPPHLPHLSHLVLLLFHKWPLLFSISLSYSSTSFFPLLFLLLLALHSKLSRVADHYPQSQALNQRIFTLSIMCSPSLSLSLPVDVSLPLKGPLPSLFPWHEDVLPLPLLTQQWLLTPFTKDDMLLTD